MLQGFEARGEVTQPRALLDDPVPAELGCARGDLLDDLGHVVDVRLRVDAARDREPHELHRSRFFGTVVADAAEHHAADLDGADPAGPVELDTESMRRELQRGDVRQERLGVDVDRVPAGRRYARYAGAGDFLP